MDSSSLRSILASVDMSAPSIQRAASAMMKHYDRSAGIAVTEWRNALQTSPSLALLYVANEVLQTSKRNRGNNFLVEFSPILGQSLQYICQRSNDLSVTEKVRRTIKIWGDRHVFSIRFVNELLSGLEPYRRSSTTSRAEDEDGARFSPVAERNSFQQQKSAAAIVKPAPPVQPPQQQQQQQNQPKHDGGDSNDDDVSAIMAAESDQDDGNDDDDDDDIFADSSQPKLGIDILAIANAANAATATSSTDEVAVRRKRNRRGSGGGSGGAGSQQVKKRKRSSLLLSANGWTEILHKLNAYQQRFDTAQFALDQMQNRARLEDLEQLVGDELQQTYKQNSLDQINIIEQRKTLYEVARERKELEGEALRYLRWLEDANYDDLELCDRLEQKILSFRKIFGQVVQARNVRVAEEERRRAAEEERERIRREEEELKKFRKAALAKETEAKPGMVWNPSTREYQSLNLDESWRD